MAALGINLPIGNVYIGALKALITKPIGMLMKYRRALYSHLSRNAGGLYEYGYDSWGTPIGMPADFDYTERYGRPLYLNDRYRDEYPNYVNYVKDIYGSSLSVTNINTLDTFLIKPENEGVGSMELETDAVRYAIDNPVRDVYSPINPNYTSVDTILGEESSWHLGETMATSRVFNTERQSDRIRSISSIIPYTFGMNNEAYSNAAEGFRFKVDSAEGRNDSIFETLTTMTVADDKTVVLLGGKGPIYSEKTKDNLSYYIDTSSSYYDYIKSLSSFEESFRENNLKLRSNLDIDGGNLIRGSRQKFYTPEKEGTYVYKAFTNQGHLNPKISKEMDIDGFSVRYIFESNRKTIQSSWGNVTTMTYAEADGNKSDNSIQNASVGSLSRFSTFQSYDNNVDADDLIDYTNKSFRKGKIDTLIARFHSNEAIDKTDSTATAWSSHGYSHGRNLLRKNHNDQSANNVNGYDNPYCRVWTYHHQYHRFADTIRPMSDDGRIVKPSDLDFNNGWSKFRSPDTGMDGGTGGGRLTKHGVINYDVNGLINITPTNDGDESRKVDIKRCMFSIENLAWKDAFSVTGGSSKTSQNIGLSKEQKGPFGGRIMWFPPYDLSFNESITSEWNTNNFIGRGESIYTYANTSRSGTLSFKLLIDHPSIINYWRGRKETDGPGNVDDVNSNEQTLLRFFAGCEKLDSAPEPQPEPEPEPEPVTPPPAPEVDMITVFLFFPNNYTGDSDGPDKAMKYLMNGMGAGKIKKNGQTVDYQIEMKPCKDSSGKIVGGYEVRGGCPISIITKALDPNKNGFITNAYQDNKVAPLMSMNGDGVNSPSSPEWWKKKWAYRVDKDKIFINEVLHQPIHYVDTESYCLNSGGNRDKILKTFSGVESKNLFSFTELYVALGNSNDASILKGCYDEDNVVLLKKLFETYKISNIDCLGWASSNGDTKRNSRLATRRAKIVKLWAEDKLKSKLDGKITYKKCGIAKGPKISDVSDLNQKIYRCAQINIKLQISDVNITQNTQKGSENTSIKVNKNNDNSKGQNGHTDKAKNLIERGKNILNSISNSTESNTSDSTKDEKLERYDNEADFFRLLELNDPVTHHKITDKIKFFDPAFHSVSPEGFNARLTFLQQCMRQGPTVGGSDINMANANTANNLAFGRPPVCILRLGDFYYTKIIIHNLDIRYETPWDLNTEGIGVMPMIANVSISFNFIGGSSLAGPIDRLQNALSFNMYANTEVYDNRAEQVDYDEDGKIIKYKAFEPK